MLNFFAQLSERGPELEDHSMVRKVIYPVLPPKVEYFLTTEGESLLTIIDAMQTWGEAHGDEIRSRIAG